MTVRESQTRGPLIVAFVLTLSSEMLATFVVTCPRHEMFWFAWIKLFTARVPATVKSLVTVSDPCVDAPSGIWKTLKLGGVKKSVWLAMLAWKLLNTTSWIAPAWYVKPFIA